MKTLILWSGGLDSTYCLLKLIDSYSHDIITLYVDLECNYKKSWIEKGTITSIQEDLKSALNAIIVPHYSFKLG